MVNIRNDQLVYSVFASAFFVGINFSTFLQSLRCLLFTHKRWELRPTSSIQWRILLVSVSIFVLGTINHGVELKTRAREALVGELVQNWRSVVVCTTANLTAQLTDAVLVWRLWKIYNNSYRVVAFPVFLWVGGLVLTILQIYLQAVKFTQFRVWLPVNVNVGPGIILTPFWGSTVLLNLYSTSMIIFRLRKFKQESLLGHATQAIDFVASLVVESGSLYLIPGIAHFVVWWTPSAFAINLVADINIPMLGIAFNLIIIRLFQHDEQEQRTQMHVTSLQFEHANTVKTEDMEDTPSSEMTVYLRP